MLSVDDSREEKKRLMFRSPMYHKNTESEIVGWTPTVIGHRVVLWSIPVLMPTTHMSDG
jgi:uncharacterized membrane protein